MEATGTEVVADVVSGGAVVVVVVAGGGFVVDGGVDMMGGGALAIEKEADTRLLVLRLRKAY